jgi:hypothetical protein
LCIAERELFCGTDLELHVSIADASLSIGNILPGRFEPDDVAMRQPRGNSDRE